MRLLSTISLILFGIAASAQDSLQLFHLNEVVITGELEPQSIEKSVYNVRTIPMERLHSQGATRLQDVLNTELNIRFTQDLALGGSNVTMMGLPGQNVKVLIDGIPMIGRQGTGNEINLNQINVASIERIEIVEGPMAVIYGADAIAGVINIITRKTIDGTWSIGGSVQEETAGTEYGISKGLHNQALNIGYKKKAFYSSANLNHNKFHGWKGDSLGREMEWHPKEQWLGGVVLGFEKGKFNTYYRGDFLHEKIYNPAEFKGNEAIDENYITKRLAHQLQTVAKLSEKLSLTTSIGYTNYERRTQSIAVNRKTGRETLAGSAENRFTGLTVRGSLPYKVSENTTIQIGYDVNHETGEGARLQNDKNSITDLAAFVSADLKISSILSLRPGVRFIKNSVYQAPPVIPSLNAKLTVNETNDLRLSYGRGFRAPSIRELFFDFFDASHSIEGNPNLEAELSHSVNAAWNSRIVTEGAYKLSTTLSLFYNDVENLIDYGLRPGSNVTTYLNVSRFKSQGVNAMAVARIQRHEFKAGFGYTGRYNSMQKVDSSLPEFVWSPEVNASATMYFSDNFSAYVCYKYTGRTPSYFISGEDAIVLGKVDGYHWVDISVQKSFLKYLTVSAGVRNVLDVTRLRNTNTAADSGHSNAGAIRPMSYGRSYFASLAFQLTK